MLNDNKIDFKKHLNMKMKGDTKLDFKKESKKSLYILDFKGMVRSKTLRWDGYPLHRWSTVN